MSPKMGHPSLEKTLYLLTGPTAVGKTDVSLRWAEKYGAEIVSCDSLLFYRGMDIGTAKPTQVERARVPHHLIDVCSVGERMDINRYIQAARVAIEGIVGRGRRVLVVGGSGFYLRSFFAPVVDSVEVGSSLRAEIASKLASDGVGALVSELRALNPAGIEGLDTDNPRRVVRALERCRASGLSLKELNAAFASQPLPFADWQVQLSCLNRPKEELKSRIERRVQMMLRDGLVEETKKLIAEGLKENPSASKAIGYRESIEVVEGRKNLPELADSIAANTRALVKKQLTWFRTQLPDHRIVNANTSDEDTLFDSSPIDPV